MDTLELANDYVNLEPGMNSKRNMKKSCFRRFMDYLYEN